MWHTLLDILYPVRCPICQEIVLPKGNRICVPCRAKLKVISEPRCKKCGKPIELEEKEFCDDCERNNYHFLKGYSVWIYDSVMKKSISDYKYHNKKENAKFYIQELLSLYRETILKLDPDVLVPVPIHKSKYRVRGYNQADILACGISKELGIPVLSHLLTRNRKTLPQKQLDNKERLSNLKKAFGYNFGEEQHFHGRIRRVLLVDDIYTTGSTIEACARVLSKQGIEQIYFITLCIGRGYD
ncbi:MAG TPA: ComF family protein [Mobilitalea sp.]|nr:ComF family protein [Mobilitalea sp.]